MKTDHTASAHVAHLDLSLIQRRTTFPSCTSLSKQASVQLLLGRLAQSPCNHLWNGDQHRLPYTWLLPTHYAFDPCFLQMRYLIAHKREQRRDHDSRPWCQQCWQLVTQRFSTSGGHDADDATRMEISSDRPRETAERTYSLPSMLALMTPS